MFMLDDEVVTSSQVIKEANSLGPSIRGESPDLFDCEEEHLQETFAVQRSSKRSVAGPLHSKGPAKDHLQVLCTAEDLLNDIWQPKAATFSLEPTLVTKSQLLHYNSKSLTDPIQSRKKQLTFLN